MWVPASIYKFVVCSTLFSFSLISQWIMASDLQGDSPFHSTLPQEVAATNAQGVGQDRRFGQTKRGLRGYFVLR